MSNPGSQPNSNAWDWPCPPDRGLDGGPRRVSASAELSHYELHRKPHETVTDSSAIAVSPRALHSELMCPICLDLMKNTLTTKECLHRFCQDCIITALRSGNKECPTCRKKLVSKRSLRPDPNFDSLISKVYPNRDELNEEQEKSQSRRGGVPLKRKRKAPTSGTPSPEHETPDTPQQPEPKRAKASFESETQEITPVPTGHRVNGVELQLRPHPNDPSVADHATRNLSTSAVSTVSHLVKFLSVHTLLDGDKAKAGGSAVRALNFEGGCDGSGDRKYMLYISLGEEEEFSILPSGTSLKQVCDTYWTPGDKLKLYFAIDDQLSS